MGSCCGVSFSVFSVVVMVLMSIVESCSWVAFSDGVIVVMVFVSSSGLCCWVSFSVGKIVVIMLDPCSVLVLLRAEPILKMALVESR